MTTKREREKMQPAWDAVSQVLLERLTSEVATEDIATEVHQLIDANPKWWPQRGAKGRSRLVDDLITGVAMMSEARTPTPWWDHDRRALTVLDLIKQRGTNVQVPARRRWFAD